MTGGDDFTPRLGRIGNRGAAAGKRYSARVRKAAAKRSKGRRGGYAGERIGRGSAAGRAVSFRKHPFAKFRMRRVIVKTHIARAAKGIGKAAFKAHLKYIQRDGVDRAGPDGESLGGDLYNDLGDKIDDNDFLARSEEDRHQFRIIVSPEDADQLASLKENTRGFMAQIEKDLGTKLDWIAVDHYNTGHPHTHIVIRGKDERGKDLIIAREYLTRGMRQLASDIVTQELGPRRDMEIARSHHSDVAKDRLTNIDRRLAELADGDLVEIKPASGAYNRFQRSLALSRLNHLEGLSLAIKEGSATWRLDENWQETLKAMGKRGDIIRTLSAIEGGARDVSMFDNGNATQAPVLGRVLTSQAEDELRDTRALIVEGIDGRTWHIPFGPQPPGSLPPKGAIVEASRLDAKPRQSDRTIAAIAAVNGGIYSEAGHRDDDPSASDSYVEAHKRRLEALRRAGIVQRFNNGDWRIPDDYLDRAAAFEALRDKGAKLNVKSWATLADQIVSDGPTWLDEVERATNGKTGFGKEVASAKQQRQLHLMTQGVLESEAAHLSDEQRGSMLAVALQNKAAKLAARSGKTYQAAEIGARFEGVYERPVTIGSKRFAMIAKSKEFTLVPWRPELEKARGLVIQMRRTGNGVSWTIGQSRGRGIS